MTKLHLNMDDVDLETLSEFEEYTGVRFGELSKLTDGTNIANLPTKVLIGVAFLALRSSDPAATLDDAKKLKVGALSAMEVSQDPPTGATS